MKNICANRISRSWIQRYTQHTQHMLFKKFFVSIILLLTTGQLLYSQSHSQGAILTSRHEIGGTGLDSMMEYSSAILEYSKHYPSSALAIRLCSKNPLPVAIATAAIEPVTLARYLSRYPVATTEIIISRSELCLGKIDTNTATELWIVPAGQQFPEAKESVKVCQIRVQELKSHIDEKKGVRIGTYNYVLAVKKLISELKANPNATGVILGYYLQEPTEKIKKKLLRAQRILKKSGLPSNRYYIQSLYWTGFPEIENQLSYLRVGIVRIIKECRSLGDKNEIIWVDG